MFPSILIQLENGPNEIYFYFYFVLQSVKQKIKKTMASAIDLKNWIYHKFLPYQTLGNFAVINLKFKQGGQTIG